MLTPGHVIDGRYEILGPLGAGGMGQIYKARRVTLGDEVALKVLLSPEADREARERFLRESRASAQLRHPHIVSILDFDMDADGRPFLVMELLSGHRHTKMAKVMAPCQRMIAPTHTILR